MAFNTKVKINNIDVTSPALFFLGDVFKKYDFSKVEYILLSRHKQLHGICYYPSRKFQRKKFKIQCHVPETYPYITFIREKPIYITDSTQKPQVPEGCTIDGSGINVQTSKSWYIVSSRFTVQDVNEALVFIVGHEIFHYLRRTRQIPGVNLQSQADVFGKNLVKEYKEYLNTKGK